MGFSTPIQQTPQLQTRLTVHNVHKPHAARLQKSFATGQEVTPVHTSLQHGLSRRKLLTHCTAQLVTQYSLKVPGVRADTVSRNGNGNGNGAVNGAANGTDKALTPPTYVKATGRVVAIGDIHGDIRKCIRCLELAGLLTSQAGRPVWIGGDTVVVQLGDVLDRGDSEIAVILLLRDLDRQARELGGAVYMLNGNHESLNVCGNFRYVTPGAFLESANAAGLQSDSLRMWDNQVKARLKLYSPGGAMARQLAKNPTVLMVNDTVFAHGGLLPVHVEYGLERINREVAAWMRGDRAIDGSRAAPPFLAMGNAQSVMWNRTFGTEKFKNPYDRHHMCTQLTQSLSKCGAKRLVVGHTPQMGGANCECDGKVWRVDVGMSRGVLDAPAAVLEIVQNPLGETVVGVVTEHGPSQVMVEQQQMQV